MSCKKDAISLELALKQKRLISLKLALDKNAERDLALFPFQIRILTIMTRHKIHCKPIQKLVHI